MTPSPLAACECGARLELIVTPVFIEYQCARTQRIQDITRVQDELYDQMTQGDA